MITLADQIGIIALLALAVMAIRRHKALPVSYGRTLLPVILFQILGATAHSDLHRNLAFTTALAYHAHLLFTTLRPIPSRKT